jgi:microcystin-dependent protein
VSRWIEPGAYTITVSGAGFTTVARTFDAVRGDGATLIADNSVGVNQLGESVVTSVKFANNALTNGKFAGSSVREVDINTDAITLAKVADNAVSNDKLANNSVTDTEIEADSVQAAHIAASAIGSAEIASATVTEPKVANNAILRQHISIEIVTSGKIAHQTITSAHIPDRSLAHTKLAEPVIPLGAVIPYAGSTPPGSHWAICNGQALNRTTYADLFTLLGTAHGTGDGSTTFNIPDYRGRTLVGVGTMTEVNALTDNDGIVTAGHNIYRGPLHGHTLGTFAVASSGNHTHTYAAPQDGGGTLNAGAGPDTIYDGNTLGGTAGNTHTHSMAGLAGDVLLDLDDHVAFGTVTFLMKVLPADPGVIVT